MKSRTISVWSGIGLCVLLMAGCSDSGSTDVAHNSNSTSTANTAVAGNTGGGRGGQNADEAEVLPFINNDKSENESEPTKAEESESAQPKAPADATETKSSEESKKSEPADARSELNEPKPAGSENRSGGSMLAEKPATSESSKNRTSTGSKRTLRAAAEPTGKTGTDPGDTLPQIEGKDVDGIEFALSDYDGKVKMIDFWGDW